jgi:hypothetical protein
MAEVTIDNVAIGSSLRPNGPASNVTVTITNPNNFAVQIASISASSVISDTPGCSGPNTGVTLDLSDVTGMIPATTTATYASSASMSVSAAQACQGATFSTELTLSVTT